MRLDTNRRSTKLLAALTFLCIFTGIAVGQVATGTLAGTVTDAKGLAMAGVNVLVHNVDTGVDQRPAMTNDQGVYQVPLLQPGNYEVTASQTGFSTVKRAGVALQVGATVRVDIEMPVSAQQTLVTVTTEIPLLETEKTEQSQNVSESLVTNLPVSSRRWEQFALLTPGVNPDGTSGGMSFHGLNNNYNNNSVDGANNNSSYNAGSRGGASDGYVYSGDSIREFQVSSTGFGAELGQAAGGAVNAVTKSGTNGLHGDLFYNGRAAVFNALDPVASANAAANKQVPTQSVHQQHQYGFSVGGPLVKDKLFFFATMDGYRKVNPLTTTTSQLTPSINALTCPTVTSPAGVGAGATAPTAAQCQAAKDFVFRNIIGTFSRLLKQDIEFIKLDYQATQANHLSAVTNIRDWKNPTDPISVNGGTSYLQSRFVIGTWTAVISNNKVNEFRYQWGKDVAFNALTRVTGAPQVQLSNLFNYGQSNGSTFTLEHRNQISDNFSFTKGTHSFKTGVDFNFIHDEARSSVNSAGSYSYSSGISLGPNISCLAPVSSAQASNTIFCDWLMDLYGKDAKEEIQTVPAPNRKGKHWGSYTQITDARFAGPPKSFSQDFTDSDYSAYFQDTWKVRPNLTINAGLRYDVQIWPPLQYPAAFPPILASFTTTTPNDFTGIQPRLGVAWNFSKRSVLRVGGGIYYAKTTGSAWKTVIDGSAEPQLTCSTTKCVGSLVFPNVLFNQQDTLLVPAFTSASLGAGQPLTPAVVNPTGDPCPCGARGIDPKAQRPRAYQFQAAIEQQIPWNMNLSVSYVFTRGVKLPSTKDANIASNIDPAFGRAVTKTYDVVDGAGATVLTATLPLYWNRIDARTGAIIAQYSDVNSRYNGMIITVRKAPSHGVEVVANYTLSKSTDNGQAGVTTGGEGFLSTDGVTDPFNMRLEQGYSGTDARHRFTTSVVWQPAFGKNYTGILRQIVSGWGMSSSVTATNGNRYGGGVQSTSQQSVTYTNPVGSATPTTTYTGVNGGMAGAAIQTTANLIGGRISWVPRGFYQYPNIYNVDFRLTKEFTIRERFSLEFRGEAFNLFNSTIVQGVNQNAYNYAAPGATGCPISHAPNTCMVKINTFQSVTSTSGNLFGARQLQAGVRFNF